MESDRSPWIDLADHFADLHDELEQARPDAGPPYDRQRFGGNMQHWQELVRKAKRHADHYGCRASDVFVHACRRFLNDPWARKTGYKIRFLDQDFDRWARGLAVAS